MVNQLLEKRREQMFPKLTAAQSARLEAHGRRLQTRAGEVLVESGERPRSTFIVVAGSLDVLLPTSGEDELLLQLTPGDFTGEMSTLRGSSNLARIVVREGGWVLAIDVGQLRAIVQTDAELSELFMRAFILRRVAIMSTENSQMVLIGSTHSADTLRLQEFLQRNGYPYHFMDVDTDPDVQALVDRLHIQTQDLPVFVCRGERVAKNPSNRVVAECLGINPQIDDTVVHDLLIVGAGPTGLAAAVYAASEGLDVRLIEATAPGGQAGTSSKIENYLGFPTGISGQALAGRALSQATKFGANLSVAMEAVKLQCDRRPYRVDLADGSALQARVVVSASGARYRTLELDNATRFLGVGIYYAATGLEAKLCGGGEIVVVGGGNSAGQAAVFLASSCRKVHVLVRSAGLAERMSNYLVRRIEESPNIQVHPRTLISSLEGSDRLERLTWRDASKQAGVDEQHEIGHVFLMTGAEPNTQWLRRLPGAR